MNDAAASLLLAASGLVLAGHGFGLIGRQLRTGGASVKFAGCPRSARPAAFLAVLLINGLVALFGTFLLTISIFFLVALAK